MALVSGSLNTLGLATFVNRAPRLLFVPSGPAAQSIYLYGSAPIEATFLNASEFTVTLASTEFLTPETWYTLRIEWLDEAGNFTSVDTPRWKIRVPAGEHSRLVDLIDLPLVAGDWWVGTEAGVPHGAAVGDFVLNPVTGDVDRIV